MMRLQCILMLKIWGKCWCFQWSWKTSMTEKRKHPRVKGFFSMATWHKWSDGCHAHVENAAPKREWLNGVCFTLESWRMSSMMNQHTKTLNDECPSTKNAANHKMKKCIQHWQLNHTCSSCFVKTKWDGEALHADLFFCANLSRWWSFGTRGVMAMESQSTDENSRCLQTQSRSLFFCFFNASNNTKLQQFLKETWFLWFTRWLFKDLHALQNVVDGVSLFSEVSLFFSLFFASELKSLCPWMMHWWRFLEVLDWQTTILGFKSEWTAAPLTVLLDSQQLFQTLLLHPSFSGMDRQISGFWIC